jgi:hypothetical protein
LTDKGRAEGYTTRSIIFLAEYGGNSALFIVCAMVTNNETKTWMSYYLKCVVLPHI